MMRDVGTRSFHWSPQTQNESKPHGQSLWPRYIVRSTERVNEAPRRLWEVSSSARMLAIVFHLPAMFARIKSEVMLGLVVVSKVWCEAINNKASRAWSLSHTTLRRWGGATQGSSICNYEKGRRFGGRNCLEDRWIGNLNKQRTLICLLGWWKWSRG
jgi:hypothetical protein